jgi:hypothetical protein
MTTRAQGDYALICINDAKILQPQRATSTLWPAPDSGIGLVPAACLVILDTWTLQLAPKLDYVAHGLLA